jgi:hypothetical protein
VTYNNRAGMFMPGTNSLERTEKCTLGVTALLTIAILLLIVCDMMPRGNHLSILGMRKNYRKVFLISYFSSISH